MKCYLCKDECEKSYFMGIYEGMNRVVVEVCPDCHHHFTYGTDEQKELYKKRRDIKF